VARKLQKRLRKFERAGWWREKLRKHKMGAIALSAAVGGMKMLLTHGMFGSEDIIIPILGALGAGAVAKLGIEAVDDVLEQKQERVKYKLLKHREVKLIGSKEGQVATEAGEVDRTI
jgi:hypothetical protein